MRTSTLTLAVATFLFAAMARGANQVLIVDKLGIPGQTYPEVQDAVDAAADGDIILIRDGSYGRTTFGKKSLTLVGDPQISATRPIIEGIVVQSLAPNQRVVVRGLHLRGVLTWLGGPALWLIDNAGSVVLEDLELETLGALSVPLASVNIVASQRVLFTRCSVRGHGAVNDIAPSARPAGPGMDCSSSNVFLYESVIEGGAGDHAFDLLGAFWVPALPGATAIDAVGGSLSLVGCTVRGGRGGDGVPNGSACVSSANGGIGLAATSALVRLMDTTVSGGDAGVDPGPCPQVGVDGADLVTSGASIAAVPGTLCSFVADSPVHEGQSVGNTFIGEPGKPVVMLVSLAPAVAWAPSLKGSLLCADPIIALSLGTVPPSGEMSFNVPLPLGTLPAGIDGIDVYEQMLSGHLSSPTVVTLLR